MLDRYELEIVFDNWLINYHGYLWILKIKKPSSLSCTEIVLGSFHLLQLTNYSSIDLLSKIPNNHVAILRAVATSIRRKFKIVQLNIPL